jgi:glycine/D-amino acid oxidase-like deaminating enzyme
VTVAGRLTIIGGGVMGLMAAYYAAPLLAPWVGRVLAQLAVQRGTVYDIGRFTPARFAGGAPVTGVAS